MKIFGHLRWAKTKGNSITQWIWPRPTTQLTKWNYSLPSFNLSDSYNIHVGKIFTTNPEFIPFVHWQNALFIISAGIVNSSDTISWLEIDQPNKSIIFDLSQIKSVGNYNISMSAKMITYFINSTDTSKYTTIISKLKLEISLNVQLVQIATISVQKRLY